MTSNQGTACFACTTPYQIMGAVCIAAEKKLVADLVLAGVFSGYREIGERIRETGVFRNVVIPPLEKYWRPGKKGVVKQMLRARSLVEEFLPREWVYGTYYYSSRANLKNILLHELYRRNPKLRLVLYEDGLGTYQRDSHVLNTSSSRSLAEKFLGWNLYRPERTTVLVNLPELFEKPDSMRDCPVEKMPAFNSDPARVEMLKYVFGVREEDRITRRAVIFDPMRSRKEALAERERIMDECYDLCAEALGRENLIVKPHPRSRDKTTAQVDLYEGTSIPMEVLYADMDNLDDRVLITYASSAVYTPKMFYDREPWVLNLFRITDNTGGQVSEWEAPYLKFRGVYRNPEKLMAPATLEELRECLRKVRDADG